eukprot:1144236-Pelagomonas_calceolata.AAC.7
MERKLMIWWKFHRRPLGTKKQLEQFVCCIDEKTIDEDRVKEANAWTKALHASKTDAVSGHISTADLVQVHGESGKEVCWTVRNTACTMLDC